MKRRRNAKHRTIEDKAKVLDEKEVNQSQQRQDTIHHKHPLASVNQPAIKLLEAHEKLGVDKLQKRPTQTLSKVAVTFVQWAMWPR